MKKSKHIYDMIERLPKGKLFDISTLMDDTITPNDIAVSLCNMKKEGTLRTLMKGIFYKPKFSKFGYGELPVDEEEIVNYYINKYDAHLSGLSAYNAIGLTEQNPVIITLAGNKPFRKVTFKCFGINYSKSNIGKTEDSEAILVIILDAIKDINHIAGLYRMDAYEKLKHKIDNLNDKQKERIISYAYQYPTRVRFILSKMMGNDSLKRTVTNVSKYDREFKNTFAAQG